MAAANILCFLLVGFVAYGMLEVGFEWYYVLPSVLFAFGIMSAFMQLSFSLFDMLFKKSA